MKFNFTLLGLFLLFSSALMGQAANTLVITSPMEIAGDYPFSTASSLGWGDDLPSPIFGTAEFIIDGTDPTTDACEDTVEALGSNWGFADRGVCQFSTKALFIQNAGGNVAVICNNVPGDGPITLNPGTDAAAVNIPVISLSFESCERIRAVGQGVEFSVTTEFVCEGQGFGPEYLWGTNTGEGDFSAGFGDWEVQNFAPNGNGWIIQNGLDEGGTNCNGYASFPGGEYFFNELNGGCDIPGGYSNAAGLGGHCSGALISPTIALDPAAIDENLVVEFNHFFEYWNDGTTNLVVSFDDGLTWPDTFNISAAPRANVVNTAPFYPLSDGVCDVITSPTFQEVYKERRMHIDTYNGQSSIKLQFLHIGVLGQCTIDDVALLNLPDFHDIEIDQFFVSYAPAFQMPLSQAQEVPLHVDVNNVGISTVNTVVQADAILDATGNVEFTATNDAYGGQPGGCFLNQNLSFEEFYIPTELGNHTVFMTNVTPDDAVTNDDDQVNFPFTMTDNTWASTPPAPRLGDGSLWDLWTNFTFQPSANWAIAYPFYVPEGDGHFLNSVRFGIQNRDTNSGDIFAYILKWTPTDASFPLGARGAVDGDDTNPGVFFIDPSDTEVVGTVGTVYGFTTNRIAIAPGLMDSDDNPVNVEDITFQVVKSDDAGNQDLTSDFQFKPLSLDDDSHYVIVLAVAAGDQNTDVDFASWPSGPTNQLYHVASNFAYANGGLFVRPNGHASNLPDAWTNDDLFGLTWAGAGNGVLPATEFSGNLPWIEMDINQTPIFETSTEEISEEVAQGISLFPNPVSDNLTINVDLNEMSATIRFDLTDISGKLVRSDSYRDVQKGAFNMNVADLIPGVYTLNVRTEAGFSAKKVIIQK